MVSRRQLPPQIKKLAITDRKTGKTVVRYQLTVDAGTDPITGKRRQVRKRFDRLEDAKNALTEISGKVARDEFVPRRAFTVDDLCADWLASLHLWRLTPLAAGGN